MFVGSAFIDMYAKCKSTINVQLAFEKSPIQINFMWSDMITSYVHIGHGEEALKLFFQMQVTSPKPDQFTFNSLLRACISLATLENGKQIHVYIIKTGFESWLFVGTNIVDMYAKCGSLLDYLLFWSLTPPNPEQNQQLGLQCTGYETNAGWGK